MKLNLHFYWNLWLLGNKKFYLLWMREWLTCSVSRAPRSLSKEAEAFSCVYLSSSLIFRNPRFVFFRPIDRKSGSKRFYAASYLPENIHVHRQQQHQPKVNRNQKLD